MRTTPPEGPEFSYTAKNRENFEEFASHYAPENRVSAVLHALYLVQEQQGYISNNAVRHVAQVIGCTTAEVEDVVSYYVMFHRGPWAATCCRSARRSRARSRCRTCIEELQGKLGIKVGETDPTGMFTIQQMECLGARDRAPVMMVNNDPGTSTSSRKGKWPGRSDEPTASRRSTTATSARSASLRREGDDARKGESATARLRAGADEIRSPGGAELDHYIKNQNGYEGLKKALTAPDAVIEDVGVRSSWPRRRASRPASSGSLSTRSPRSRNTSSATPTRASRAPSRITS
jgi:NADH-quinone oxidoreductase subunit E